MSHIDHQSDEYMAGLADGRSESRGAFKTAAKFQRKYEAVAAHIIDLIAKAQQHKHEISRLEDLLAWVYRTDQPVEEIKRVVGREIPRRIHREQQQADAENNDGDGI